MLSRLPPAATCFVTLLAAGTAGAADVPFEGDRAALETVLAAVAGHRAALAEGSLRYRVTAPADDGPFSGTDAKGVFAWRGDRGLNRFDQQTRHFVGGGDGAVGRRWIGEMRLLRTPAATHWFDEVRDRLVVSHFPPDSGKVSLPQHGRFWPQHDWFANSDFLFEDSASRWDVMFDPSRTDANATTRVIRAEFEGDRVRLSRTFENGNSDWAVADRTVGWNVVDYGGEVASGGEFVGTGVSFDWERDGGGPWRVREMVRRHVSTTGDETEETWTFSDFRTAAPAELTFTEEDLRVPTDAVVRVTEVTESGRRTRRIGRDAAGVPDSKLRGLGALLRRGSFLNGDDE